MTRTESLIYRRRRGTTGAQRPASLLALTCGAAMTRPVLGHVWGAEAVQPLAFANVRRQGRNLSAYLCPGMMMHGCA